MGLLQVQKKALTHGSKLRGFGFYTLAGDKVS